MSEMGENQPLTRRERIAEILEKRKPLSQKIDQARNYVKELLSALSLLDDLIPEYQRLSASSENLKKIAINEIIVTKDIQSTLNSQLEHLFYLYERFSKPPLKIAVAGLPKEGKSTFIRAVTELREEVIPSSEELCTGASSTIYNHDSTETYGEIEFYSSDVFLKEVIQPYYNELNLTDKPISLDAWKQPSFTKQDAIEQTKYKRLLAYYEKYSKYKDYLNQKQIRVAENDIRQYIAQVDINKQPIDIYRSVKNATIYTKFPNHDVGQIALLDTPGLGELRSREEEKLVEILRKSADIVICLILPKHKAFTYQESHTNFFSLMQKGIGQADKRCLLVLNDDGNNSQACQRLSQQDKLAEWTLTFAKVFVANCSKPEQVQSQVVDPTINYLAEKISSLDWDDTQHRFNSILEQCAQTSDILHRINVESSGNIDISSQRYRKLFEKDFVPKLSNAFKQMQQYFFNRQDISSVKKIVRDKVNALEFSIPSAQEIELRRTPKETYDKVFIEILGELRVQGWRHFQDLDIQLSPLVDELKKIVADEFHKIGLDRLSNREGSDFIENIYTLIPKTCPMLKLAFQMLKEFELAYFWLIRVKIYEGLEILDPRKNNLKPDSSNSSKPVTAELFYQALDASCIAAKSKLLALLGGDATDDFSPNNAVRAALEEFIDLVFYAWDEQGRGIVSGEWQDFLEPHKRKIWAEDFGKLEQEIELRDKLSNAVEQARNSITKLQRICNLEGVL
ncbi:MULTISPECIES: dynamin family protein [Calothrix]|uniref:Dynamin family protein n=2 Tax=Calothrix TaxID=1186 RepID=A0ABR8AJS8_9CYAN|nr:MULTISPECIES: dynamin family protein [Calothrix]MBD2199523.1 dynamin family protein [Calothrix parietina FACHB-288]MBD2228324.1 dynamin family protein [Calothrix anomala FACHB-343]